MKIPSPNCELCPRLQEFRQYWRTKQPHWHNSPVPSFGEDSAWLLIVGLAPGLEGANCTGRPFTADYAGDLLYPTLIKFKLAEGNYQEHANDGLKLIGTRITNAVRCVPPQNKPTTQEIKNCRPFLNSELTNMPNLKIILSLGHIAHDQVLATLNAKAKDHAFGHNAVHNLGDLTLVNSYHCSRYNTNTGRLTTTMFENVFQTIQTLHLDPLK